MGTLPPGLRCAISIGMGVCCNVCFHDFYEWKIALFKIKFTINLTIEVHQHLKNPLNNVLLLLDSKGKCLSTELGQAKLR